VGDILPKPDMMRRLRQTEIERLAGELSGRLNASYVPVEPGRQIVGVYDRSVTTPTGRLAVIRHQDTFTLAPWRPALEPFKGRAVMGMIGPNRVTWSLDRAAGCREGVDDRPIRIGSARTFRSQWVFPSCVGAPWKGEGDRSSLIDRPIYVSPWLREAEFADIQVAAKMYVCESLQACPLSGWKRYRLAVGASHARGSRSDAQ
jgi:hypothetical protein